MGRFGGRGKVKLLFAEGSSFEGVCLRTARPRPRLRLEEIFAVCATRATGFRLVAIRGDRCEGCLPSARQIVGKNRSEFRHAHLSHYLKEFMMHLILKMGLPAAGLTLAVLGVSPLMSAETVQSVPAETLTRTSDGTVNITAVRILEGLTLDGQLDEPYYREVPSFTGFTQLDPVEGAPATEKTEVWIFFDDTNLYIAALCWDSEPDRMIANEMRRDSNNILQNQNLTIALDTFNDKRNSVFFQTSPLGAQRDQAVTDDGASSDSNWNAVWDVRTQRFDQGWSAEFAIPFRSLRYDSNPNQVWGVILRRIIRRKNEWAFIPPMPAYLGNSAIFTISLGASLTLETPPRGLNLELKPYAIAGVRTDREATPAFENRIDRDVGLDAKYGLSNSLTLDLTYNTDFAQVEEDTRQVNLTRFSQFFPERREFFLEGQGLFTFGSGGGLGGRAVGNNTPVLFFSRRIGLNNGRPVPIGGGARLTGRVGAYSLGMLNIHAREDAPSNASPTNFSVIRVKRDVFERSNIGVLYTRRDETGVRPGQTFGVDGLYSFSPALNMNAYYARTDKPGVTSGNVSYLTRFSYGGDRYGLQVERLKVGEQFDPEVGFLRRTDFVRHFAQARFSPRPGGNRIRRFIYQGSVDYIENNQGRLDFREQRGEFGIEFFNSDRLTIRYTRDYELIPEPFDIESNVTVPVGGYTYRSLFAEYFLGRQHKLSGGLSYQQGSLYGGTQRTLGLRGGRTDFTPRFALEPNFSLNWVSLPGGQFTTSVIAGRTTYTITPRMFVSALTQYSSSSQTFSTNARFRWEYRPGSELFVVYSDGRDTGSSGFPPLVNRAFIVKINRLFRL